MDESIKKDDKVVFAYPHRGFPSDQVTVKEYLKVGKVYAVDRTEIGPWNTKVWLKERPGKEFNSIHFEHHKEI